MNRTTRTALAAAASVLALGAPATAGATTAPLPGTTFQAGDGDQEATGGLRDWATIAPSLGATTADPSGAGPDAFGLGAKEEAPGDWALVGREPSNKFDFLAAWARPETGAHEHLYLAFRRDSPNGDTYLTFELNQDTRRWDNDHRASSPAVPCRTDGDVLISYEVEPGGTAEPDPVTVRLYRWHAATRDAATGCSRTGTMTGGAVLNSPLAADPLAQGAINDGPIANHLDTDGDGRADTPVFRGGTFGEAGLDVSAAAAALGLDCAAFGQVGLHSRASVSITSALKDYVAPVPLDLDTCRTPEPPGKEPPPSSPPPAGPPAASAVRPRPAAQGQVLGVSQRLVAGRARLRGASGCVHRPFRAVVSGRQIRRVTFFVDGRRVARRTARGNQRSFSVRIRPARAALGVHRVTARVVFRAASRTRPRTLLLSFQRCARNVVSPRFTG